MSKVAASPATYRSMGTHGRSDLENKLRTNTIIIPRSSNAGHLEDEFVQNVIRYRAMGSKLKEDFPFLVIYQASSRIKDEEELIVDTLRGLPSAILIIASVGKDSEVGIDLPSDLESTVKPKLRLFIKNGHILPNDMDNEYMFHRVLLHCCHQEPDWREYFKEHWKIIPLVCIVVCLIIVVVSLIVRFA
ncbi:uncharacterized protein LOC124152181 [Haliotis rufescens]|uniref:uncharacterized protein LOC124152181 n=1 Tax=Haliotis rufescens TaxID=6454 RepID=UPI00201ED828|nr:uncharacterized protein LOC124152181 [Haliotis rufescens]XP_046380974.2 uncharacterized protein LOC124152181 [Haliotis rufescens]